MGNAVGYAPVLEMVRRGVRVGLGSDAYTTDMFESLKVANLLPKHQTGQPGAGWAEPPEMLFNRNTEFASACFGRPVGTLTAGALADLIVVDYDPPTPITRKQHQQPPVVWSLGTRRANHHHRRTHRDAGPRTARHGRGSDSGRGASCRPKALATILILPHMPFFRRQASADSAAFVSRLTWLSDPCRIRLVRHTEEPRSCAKAALANFYGRRACNPRTYKFMHSS